MIPRRILPTVFACLFAFAGLGPGSRIARAQHDTRGGPTPPRLSFTDGEVSFWRTGAEDWTQAQVNTALAAGDSLYAGDGANFEVQIGPRAVVRAGAATEIDLTSLDPGYTQFRITGGHAALDLKRLPGGQTIEIDTPNAAFTIERPGYYRVDVDENRTAFSAGRSGAATVMPAAGETTDVAENQQIILEGTETVQVHVIAAPAPDEWDRWNFTRTAQLSETPRSAQYVPPDIAGVDELDRYGDWREQPRYGHVWVPRDVQPDWAPYSTGRWVYDPSYEWTWVDESPWGWAPYHYGRWVNFDGVWGWAPGPVVVAPVYSPALVAFFGAPGIGVSVGVGLPFVSWCALGFGEPIIPWWGRPGFVGRPYWGGWGGPRVLNNVVINNTRIVNVTNITKFQNVNVTNAVVGVDRNQFGRGRMEHIRLDAQRVQRLQPVRGDLRVRPVAASLSPREASGRRPPDRLQARQVVATRPPQDPMRRLQAQGIEAKAPQRRPEPRIVRPQRASGVPGARPQAGAGASAPGATGPQAGPRARMERARPSGQQPPPVPGAQRPGGIGTGRPERRPGTAPPQPAASGASQRAVPPPPPHGARARAERASPSGRQPPPVPEAQRPGGVGTGRPERRPAMVPPQPPAPGASQRTVPPPPPRGMRGRVERTGPSGRAPAPPAARERSRPAPAREAPPARAERPARPEVPPRQQAAPQQPQRPQPPPRERAVQQQPSRPQAPSRERAVPQQPPRPQPPPRERAVQQQPPRPQAPPRERPVQQQPARGRPAAADPKAEHEAPGQRR